MVVWQKRWISGAIVCGTLLALVAGWGLAQAQSQRGRNAPAPPATPTFGPEISNIFFDDATEVVGGSASGSSSAPTPTPMPKPPQVANTTPSPSPMPTPMPTPPATTQPPAVVPNGPGGSAPSAPSGDGTWSSVVAANVLEDEVKKLVTDVNISTRVPGRFATVGHKQARKQFAMLATLFGIVAQYEGEIRWKNESAAIRDLCAAAAMACNEGTDASFQKAADQAFMLRDLLNATKLDLPAAKTEVAWADVADLTTVMYRMSEAQEQNLAGWVANEAELTGNKEQFVHEASLLAALAQVIEDPSFQDDSGWKQIATQLKATSSRAVEAATQGDFLGAQQAVSTMGQSCSACHQKFR